MPCYMLNGIRPIVHPNAFVHPTAVLIGDVQIDEACYIGPNASLRGDFGRIHVMHGANVQDNCVIHGFPSSDTEVRKNGHVGHGAILHGCIVGEDALIGMNSEILDDAYIATRCLVGAGAIVKAKFECEPEQLILGSPAKVIRKLSYNEIKWKQLGTAEYQHLSQRCLDSLQLCDPLSMPEENRKSMSEFIQANELVPKNHSKA